MSQRRIAPHGSWVSPITSELIVSRSIRLGALDVDGEDVYWLEGRSSEGGRNALVRWSPHSGRTEPLPSNTNVRSRVHEYGGAAFKVTDGVLFHTEFATQALHRTTLLAPAVPGTVNATPGLRFADGTWDRSRNRWIGLCEDHMGPGPEPSNRIVAVDLGTGQVTHLVEGPDFVAYPRLSPDGTQLAWIQWNHPAMPWDGTELWVAALDSSGCLGARTRVAGGADESVLQPEWLPDGRLAFISDPTGWWNPYLWNGTSVQALCHRPAEFGQPPWMLDAATLAADADGRLWCTYFEGGRWILGVFASGSTALEVVDLPFTVLSGLRAAGHTVAFRGASPTSAACVVRLDARTRQWQILARSTDLEVDTGYVSVPVDLSYPSVGGRTTHAFYYAPVNRDFRAPDGERPPLLVMSHGGPTGSTSSQFSLAVQYWTSRGFAVLDVNYGGSTGYGRAYRERLKGNWGVVDVEDCAAGARFLADRGDVDPRRMAITGGSAGGYTTLCALTFTETFKAGASHYGVSDLEVLARDTHKFEARYLDSLVGPYPECKALYEARSPLRHADGLSCPVIFFQGLDDKVVPPNQAEAMVEHLRARKLPVAYVTFAGEQHGFRQSASIRRALDGELYFYSRVFGFPLGEAIEPVPIENL